MGEAAAEFEDGGELSGLCRSDPGEMKELFCRRAGHVAQISEALDHFPPEVDGAGSGAACAEEKGEDLGVTERLSPPL